MKIAKCIACGCNDHAACHDPFTDGPCSWLVVDRDKGLGVCSACPGALPKWHEALLAELCFALGWQGGTFPEALRRVRQLAEVARQDAERHASAGALKPIAGPAAAVVDAAGLVAGAYSMWVMLGPDGSRFVGETPLRAAVLANRHRLTVDPGAAKQFVEAIERIHDETVAENEQLLQQHDTLNCPACAGSGHIGDLVATAPAAWRDVMAERRRQIAVEGYTAEHDGKMTCDELAKAGACYALSMNPKMCPSEWPWSADSWKPKLDYRNNLVRGAALFLAAIELHDRACAALNAPQEGGAP
jgi:hypothetical protein